jgi:hypothetical protein
MKLIIMVGTDLMFELYSYAAYDPIKYRNERHWEFKQTTADPHNEPLVLRLIDASPNVLADHMIAEAFAYNSFADSFDISWTLYSGLVNTTLSARGHETAIPATHFSFPRLRLEERIRAVVGLMNATDDYFPAKEETKTTHP